ncbi:hypothetical protein XAP412_320118 [Xanthomonas phaseoli pv. phaseoli]|uniref:Uncharacterized protein n=1 Tax=Xanthomonas campestris pv. phaseoli TaxID=317013 RepID=A0ABY1TSA0_XANCH|nr:hypothetical protein XAP6984_380115 [Xanthomonas phaseoli pv. phaseoli]SON83896.1 hypothetical protein XAP412_320118 [Xanthomonas phaseoli pv. phaseoli]
MQAAALPVEPGASHPPNAAGETHAALAQLLTSIWRRGGDSLGTTCLRPAGGFAVQAAALPVEPGASHPPNAAGETHAALAQLLASIWRRGGDSNPRGAINACLISSQVHSTALPPLQMVPSVLGPCIIRAHGPSHKRPGPAQTVPARIQA